MLLLFKALFESGLKCFHSVEEDTRNGKLETEGFIYTISENGSTTLEMKNQTYFHIVWEQKNHTEMSIRYVVLKQCPEDATACIFKYGSE